MRSLSGPRNHEIRFPFIPLDVGPSNDGALARTVMEDSCMRTTATLVMAALMGLMLSLSSGCMPQDQSSSGSGAAAPTSATQQQAPGPAASPQGSSPTGGAAPPAAPSGAGRPVARRVEVVASNLEVPWALAFAPDGRLFVTERPGRIRVIVQGRLLGAPVATLPAVTSAESGLMGLVLDPDFARNGYAYVMYTYRTEGGGMANRISRLTIEANHAGGEVVLLEGIPASSIHDGGRLALGPDGKLYATAGDSSHPDLAQDRSSLAGKILRLNLDGSVPQDNPDPGSVIYSLGHRNPEGLAFEPGSGRLYETEHGPTGNDEVNLIEPGANYGWPEVQGTEHGSFVAPISVYNPSVAPAGAAFYAGDKLGDWAGSLFFGTLRGQHLHRLVLGGPRQVVQGGEAVRGGVRADKGGGPGAGWVYLLQHQQSGWAGQPQSRGRPHPEDRARVSDLESYPFDTLPDYLAPGLRLVFVGINPAVYAVQRGHYFARPTNRFWPAFSRSHLSRPVREAVGRDRLVPEDDSILPRFGIGFTDTVKRPTPNAAGLLPADYAEWTPRLLAKLERYRPRVACFHGVTGFSAFTRYALGEPREHIELGPQSRSLGTVRLYVVPNPSGANAHYRMEDQALWYDRLAEHLDGLDMQWPARDTG